MRIEPYLKNPTEAGIVYPTVEEFCNSHFGDELIIAHEDEFEEYDEKEEKYVLTHAEICFIHGSDMRPCAYLQKKYWMADVWEWRSYPDGIHIRINKRNEKSGGADREMS